MSTTAEQATQRAPLPRPQTPISLRDRFLSDGYIVQPAVFDTATCRRLALEVEREIGPLTWPKGKAAVSAFFYELATTPAIVQRLEEFLGDDVMLWGVSVISRRPGDIHPWHTDIETAASGGKAVSVWIGIRNTNVRSSLQVIGGSHRLGMTIQEVLSRKGIARGEAEREDVVRWAADLDPRSTYVEVPVTDGDAIIFDGRLWHGSDNTNKRGTRIALLFQYATPDLKISVPDYSALDFPFRFYSVPRPPCIMISGSSRDSVNEFVPPPQHSHPSGTLITKWIGSLHPAPSSDKGPWVAHPIFRGQTRALPYMSCHMSVLEPGHTPHPPHHHDEEEILVMLSGAAKLITVDASSGAKQERLVRRGDFAYYPADHVHTITSAGEEPARYLMFKWRGHRAANISSSEETGHLPESIFEGAAMTETNGASFQTSLVFEGETSYLRKLHCHNSTVAPGAGYSPHVDAYDVAIVLLEGEVETLGSTVSNDAVIYCSAGEPHGLRNVGSDTARYLVFEFHGGRSLQIGWPLFRQRAVGLARRVARLTRINRILRRIRNLVGR